MGRTTDLEIRPFLGVSATIDKRDIEPLRASASLNADHDDGALRARRGYRNIRAATAGFTATYGMVYLQGYNSSHAEVEEYLTFDHLGASVGAYLRHVTTMGKIDGTANDPVVLTGATGLQASDWNGFAFDDAAYLINGDAATPVYKHTLGDQTSWAAMSHPAAPTTALTQALRYKSDGSVGGYNQLSFAGVVTTAGHSVAYTGGASATNSGVLSDGSIRIGHTNGPLVCSFTIDLNAGEAGEPEDQNWTNNDIFAFTLMGVNSSNQAVPATTFNISDSDIQVQLINDDGTPVSFDPTEIVSVRRVATVNCFIVVRIRFRNKTRSLWDNIRKIKVSYRVTASSATLSNNCLLMSKWFIGGQWHAAPADRDPSGNLFQYSYYASTPALESQLGGALNVPNFPLRGVKVLPEVDELGCFVIFTFTTSGDVAVTDNRLYWQDTDPIPGTPSDKRIVTQADGTTTYLLVTDYDERHAITQGPDTTGGFDGANIVGAYALREWVVWLTKESTANVRHSRIGEPLRLHVATDLETDEDRGADFTLADNAADTPLCGCQAGRSALTAGRFGVYEQLGDSPSTMSPPKRLPGSLGVANQFSFTRWKDDYGNPGAVFVDRNGAGIWFALPSNTVAQDTEGRVIELSGGIRGRLRSFLLDEQAAALSITDFTTLRVWVDEVEDALLVAMGRRAIRLTPRNPVSGVREWQFLEFGTGAVTATIKYVAPSAKRRMRWIRSTGKTDELFWNSVDNVPIRGYLRDGGNPMPQGYWRGKARTGPNRRIQRVGSERDRAYDESQIRVNSDRRDQVYTVESARQYAPCAFDQQGRVHEIEQIIPESDDVIHRLFWTETELSRRYER